MSSRLQAGPVRAAHHPRSHGHEPLPPHDVPQPRPAFPGPVRPAAVLVADLEGRIRHLDGSAFAVHGLSIDSWVGRTIAEVLPAEAHPALLPRYRAALAGEPQSFHYVTQDGRRSYWVQMAPVRDGDGTVTSIATVMEDTTERERITSELERSQARLHEAERMVGVGSWELDLDTDQLTFSPGLARLLGLDGETSLTVPGHLEHVHPDDRQIVAQAGIDCRRAGAASCEYRIIRPDGAVRTIWLQAELVGERDGTSGPEPRRYMRGAALDVTEQRAAERERLTVEHLLRQGFDAAPIGMSLSDPLQPKFVRVNDAFCRLLGRSREELLGASIDSITHPEERGTAGRSRAAMIEGGISHYQGEKRYVKPDGSVVWTLTHVAPVRRNDGSVAAFHSQIVDITERKEREERLEENVADAVWLGRIRDALDEDRLMLYAQPIVDLTTGETVQHELLLRMRGDDGRVISPAEFLPVAERYGLISEIDRWVIRQAVQIAAAGTPTEFNLSARSVGDPSILHELAGALEQTGADPALLVVEVTETALVGQTNEGRQFADAVRALGCRLALDDFGTGFSSLSYLKHLPADHLKIDMEFVRELTSSETDVRVVRGIVGLAREFDQITIAEGVEDEATLLKLKELGVDLAQGYLFGRPAPRAEVSECREPARRAPSWGCEDPVELVRRAFGSFATRDPAEMLKHCRPDIVLRPLTTSRLAQRDEPYRGHEGLLTYLRDVATVWDDLTLTPLAFRQAQESVIGFGRAEGRRGDERVLASIMWVVRLERGQISAVEIFQAADDGSMSPSQLDRLARSAVS